MNTSVESIATTAAVALRRHLALLSIGMIVAIVLAPRVVRAGDSTAEAQSPAASATRLSEEGFTLYRARDYRRAAEKFLQAYTLNQDSNLLFNIARCYEALGDAEGAIEKYEEFLSTPDADVQGKRRATQTIRELRQSKAPSSPATPSPNVSAKGPTAQLAATGRDRPAGSTGPARYTELTGEGVALYQARDYRRAAEKFLQAYAVDPDPNLLFNIGRCYAALGDEPAAIDKYQAYLKAPSTDVHARAQAQAALQQLNQRRVEPTPVLVTVPSENSPASASTGAGRGRIIAGWVATAVFAAGTAVLGVRALDSANKLKAARDAFPANGPDIASLASRTTTLTVSADALGAATALIGGLTLYWTFSGPSSSSELHAGLWPGGLRLSGSF
jgi:tetratricopeptide (TPR) repeat protein